MLEYLKEEAALTRTENGAAAWRSTGSDCLDLFASIGALRGSDDEDIIARFVRAYTEDADIAMKLLFFARDVRGGLGERRVFRTLLRWLARSEPAAAQKNLRHVAEYGRWDDLLCVAGTPCWREALRLIREQLERDREALKGGGAVSLLGKWLPSPNASSREAAAQGRRLARALGLSEAEYRKTLSALRARLRIIENNLREKDYSFDYEKQPSRALFKYRQAFRRNDQERYSRFLSDSRQGKVRLHAAQVAPYELAAPCLKPWDRKALSPEEKASMNAAWEALPDWSGDENTLAVVDTSGSMYGSCLHNAPLPAAVAFSLGLYVAERNRGAFRNHFIEFSNRPQLIELKGESFADRLQYAASFCEVANTDLEAVFRLILDTAVRRGLPQSELPAQLIIISDMEFDQCVDNSSATVFEAARRQYAEQGYALPRIVFWNVDSRRGHQPVRQNEQGVTLVSGVTPRIFSMIAGGNFSPYTLMMEVLGGERYAPIAS